MMLNAMRRVHGYFLCKLRVRDDPVGYRLYWLDWQGYGPITQEHTSINYTLGLRDEIRELLLT